MFALGGSGGGRIHRWIAASSPSPRRRPPLATDPVPRRGERREAVRSLALYVPTLFAILTFVFLLPRAMPGDPLAALEDPGSSLYVMDPAVRAQVRAHYGLDRPLLEQYGHYLVSVARGDFGWSISQHAPVASLIREHLPWTLLLMGTSLTLASVLSFLAGVAAGWRRGRTADRLLIAITTGVRAIPEYALAALFLILFAVLVPLFPLYGARTPFAEYPSPLAGTADIARHLALPATVLTLSLLGTKFLLVRNTVVSTLGEDYMLLARAKGLPDRLLKYRHAGRNALLPFLALLGIQTAFAVGGSVFVEAVFAYPGMGTLILRAVQARDYPVLDATFLTLAVVVLAVNLAVDLVSVRLDPTTVAG